MAAMRENANRTAAAAGTPWRVLLSRIAATVRSRRRPAIVPMGALVTALILAGCATRPGPDVLTPVASVVNDAKLVTVYVATTRQRAATGDNTFTARWSPTLNFAKFTISIPPVHSAPRIEWSSAEPVNTGTSFATVDQSALSEAEFRAAVASGPAAASGKHDVGIFVHGYNTNFQESLFRTAQLVADSGFNGMPILFAWPSEGAIRGYVADKEAATYSRDALANVLTMVAGARNVDEIGIAGHSMGSWLVAEALRQLRLTGQDRVVDRLDAVILAAPDIDPDVFGGQLAVIGRLKAPMVLLVARDDRALSLSARLAGTKDRVGNINVSNARIQALAVEYDVQVIDMSHISTPGFMKHDRLFGSSTFLREVARSGEPQRSGNHVGRAGAFVLNSVGTVLASPFRLAGSVLAN